MDMSPSEFGNNAHEYSVSELAFSLKRTVEDAYGRVRVRGELGRVTIAKSGHMYADIKDDKAVIASIMWKGQVSRLSVRPEEGMEVVVEGKLSTYPGRSQYQLIIDRLAPAGVGALMAVLEKRKKQFAAEGLFDEERKRALPYLPTTIGVVTSPTGAVIRDILHRITDRFPVHVLVWPVLVQGEKAHEQIAAAITGFNQLHNHDLARPDVLIVARGGGSIEDLWGFNEEAVVRAAASSEIPLISAVGHETDWTLIDYVADERAPTPTGAAEIAVPVRAELIATTDELGARLKRGLLQNTERKALALQAAKLPPLESVIANPQQRFDKLADKLAPALERGLQLRTHALSMLSTQLRPKTLFDHIATATTQLQNLSNTARTLMQRRLERDENRLSRAAQLLDALSYKGVLARGFALVTDKNGHVVRKGQTLKGNDRVILNFADTKREAVIEPDGRRVLHKKKRKQKTDENQGELF